MKKKETTKLLSVGIRKERACGACIICWYLLRTQDFRDRFDTRRGNKAREKAVSGYLMSKFSLISRLNLDPVSSDLSANCLSPAMAICWLCYV